ncbi:hypothetical protein KGQ71_00770, partial [Patescibacteria group bacterium]|nr:hypothetical protein [Patescibacteria group bacterium]
MGDGGFANTTTDNTGNFTLRLASSGNVFVGIMPPFQQPPPPNNQQQPSPTPTPTPASTDFAAVSRQTAFVKDAATPETIALGVIEVQKATATVTGKLLNPDGSGAMGGAGLMNASDHSMQPLFIQQDGSFTAKLIPGTYTLSSFDPTGAYSMPSNTTFTIKEGSNQLPSITKIANTGVVTVKAERTDNGQGIPNVQAMVFSKSGQDQPPYFATTDSNGVAHVKVPAGFQGMAGVMPGGNFGGGPQGGGSGGPQAMLPYVMALLGVDKVMAQTNPTPPPGGSSDINQLVPVTGMQEVSAGDSIVAKFAKANTQVNIRTVDSNGNLVTQGAFVDAALQSGTFPVHFGGPTAGGIGQIYVVSGTVKFQVMTPPDSPYGGVAKTVDITTNGQSVDLVLAQKTVTVTGSVLNASDNNAVIKDPSLNIQVGAFGDGAFSVGKYDPATGTYSVKILPGTPMRVGVAAGDPSQPTKGGFIPNINPKPVSGTDGQTVSLDVSLAKVDATISGKVTDNTGAPVEGLSVVADPGLAALVSAAGVDVGPGHGPDKGPQFSFNDVTDANGNFSIPVTAGTYNLLVNDHSSNLYMSSVVQATVTSGQTVSGKNIQLTKADATIKVSAVDSTGKALTGAYVHIFDDLGNISLNLPVDGSGAATADVPAGTYTFQAGKDDINSGAAQKSPFAKVLAEANKTVSVTAQTSTETGALAAPITTSVSTSSSTVVPIMNGSVTTASISIPSGALSSSSGQNGNNSGNPILAMTPIKAELPQTKADTAFTGVQITASDASGNSITSLSGSVTGQVKVNPSDLPAGLDPSNLTVKSYNSTTGQWEAVQASSVDTTKDSNGDYTVSFQTNHFTTFAVVASTDTTAPDAPTNISATDKGTGGTINLSWTNPTSSNLAGIDIYRSTTAGSLGTKVYSSISGTSKDDTGLTNGTAYYYTVRAVGTNGIESTNTTQVSATPTLAGSTPKTGDLGWWQSLKQRVEADLLSLVP